MDDFVNISNLNSFEDIKHVMYINLDHRLDRKTHVEYQLQTLNFSGIERINAIKLENGALGCSMSHLKCLQQAKERNLDHVLICEDDITFLNPNLFKEKINKFLENNKEWDVLLLGGNNFPPYKEIDGTCIQVEHCQTTTGYLIRRHYFDTLIDNIKTGISFLLRNPSESIKYAIDKYWLLLQKRDLWFLLIPLTVIQLQGYSDIEKKNTNYVNMLLKIK
jgi:GR25 family glycosyltransferase involved in LPS biosynthesis